MKKLLVFACGLLIAAHVAWAEGFTLSSKVFQGQLANDQVYSGFGCTGKNISPDLSWENAPEGTKSFAITMYDPDAPTGSGWWHWVIFDIPADTTSLPADAGDVGKKLAPKGSMQSVTSYGTPGYGGAAPPKDDPSHEYIITVYALDVDTLGLESTTTPSMVGFMIHSHALAKASIVAYYGR